MKIFKNRRNRSIISLLLVVALSCQLFVDYGVKAKAETADAVQEEITDDLAGIVSEDVDRRTEYSKYYKCNDGSYVQITSTEPVHYKDGEEYKEIDNRLKTVEKDGKTYYQNRKGDYQVLFPEELQEPVEINHEDDTLSIKLISENDTDVEMKKASVKNRKSKIDISNRKKNEKINDILPEHKSGEIMYSNEEDNVSISYQASGNRVKESITVDSPSAIQKSYVYQVEAGGLKVSKTKDGQVLFYKKTKEEPEFILEAPYMFDASGDESISYDIETKLKKKGKSYQIEYVPDMEWMLDEKRQYPIVIDPTVNISTGDSLFTDGYVNPRSAYTNYNGTSSANLMPSGLGTYYFKCNDFMTDGSAIVNSKLYLLGKNISGSPKVKVNRVTSAWDPATLTYVNKPSYESDILDYSSVNTNIYVQLDITAYAHDIVLNKADNYGIQTQMFTNDGSCDIQTIHSSSNRPYIITRYAPSASEVSDACHTASAGRAGSVKINDFTGNVLFEAEDLAIPGNRMPVSIKRVSNGRGATFNAGFGGVFYTNYHQKLKWDSRLYGWKFRTENGTEIFFNYASTGPIEDELKLGYKLRNHGKDASVYTAITIENPDGHILYFDSKGNLTRIADESQAETSAISISYVSEDKIDQITDGAGGRYKFVYNGNLISEIQYLGKSGSNVIRKVGYEFTNYVSIFTIVKVLYDDGTYSECQDEAKHLRKIANSDGSGLDMSYYHFNKTNKSNPNYLSRLSKITEYGRNRTKGDMLTYTYDVMQTTIEDLNGNKEIYQFSTDGKITSVRNQDGEAVFPTYGGENGQLLGYSDIRSSTIGENILKSSFNYNGLEYIENSHDGSIPVLEKKPYDELCNSYLKDEIITMKVKDPSVLKKGDSLVFGGWIKGNIQGRGTGIEIDRGITFRLEITLSTGEKKVYTIQPNQYVKDWQYVLKEVEIEGKISNITMLLLINKQMNHVYISELECKRIPGDGTVAADETDSSTQTSPEPTPVTDAYGNIIRETDERGAVTEYTYDSVGNELSYTKSADGKKLVSNTTYDSDKNMVINKTDTSGLGYAYVFNDDKSLRHYTDYGIGSNGTYGVVYQHNKSGDVTSIYQSNSTTDYFEESKSASVRYEYEDDKEIIKSGDNVYSIEYNPFGDISQIKHGDDSLVSYEYKSDSNRIPTKVTYGNGQSISYQYNEKNRLTSDGQATYTYNEQGELESVTDNVNATKTKFDDEKTSVYNKAGTSLLYEYEDTDDGFRFEKEDIETSVNVKDEDYVNGISEQDFYYNALKTATLKKTTDKLGRLYQTDVIRPNGVNVLNKKYQYKDINSERTTEQVSKIDYTFANAPKESESYTYSKYGNLETVTDKDGNKKYYKYDVFGQLIREDDQAQNKTTFYSYKNGNVTQKRVYNYASKDVKESALKGTAVSEINYSYNDSAWKDLLTSYNGKTITYDEIGNPLNYMGRTLSWEKGRQLASNIKDGVTTSYKYDINGLRTEKKVGSTKHEYTYVDDKLYAYEVGGHKMFFFYDENGTPSALVYNGSTYYYQTNLQGDVIGIVNYAGTKVASYNYDAWGNPVGQQQASGVGYYNPLRYRGYVYDTDTNWYYLQSRYYDPETGRFLNADAPEMLGVGESVLSYNLFSYCENNPVMGSDPTGYLPRWAHLLKGIALITSGLFAIAKAVAKGFVRAAFSSIVSNLIGGLVASALAIIPVSWWSGMAIAFIVVSLLWEAKSLLYNVPKGIWHIKQSIKHTH